MVASAVKAVDGATIQTESRQVMKADLRHRARGQPAVSAFGMLVRRLAASETFQLLFKNDSGTFRAGFPTRWMRVRDALFCFFFSVVALYGDRVR